MEEDRGAAGGDAHVGLDAVRPKRSGAGKGFEGVLRAVGVLAAVGEDEQGAAGRAYGQMPRLSATSATRRIAST